MFYKPIKTSERDETSTTPNSQMRRRSAAILIDGYTIQPLTFLPGTGIVIGSCMQMCAGTNFFLFSANPLSLRSSKGKTQVLSAESGIGARRRYDRYSSVDNDTNSNCWG
jgi:hypothetical protein